MANPTITINATGITVSGPLIAGEPVAVTASGLSLPEGAALTLALSSRAPNALLASCVLAESEETPGTWTGTLETASRQMAVYFATAAADDTRPAVIELVETTTRDSLALLVTSIRNSALIPSSSPCAVAPVYLPIPGPAGPQVDPSDAAPQMDGTAAAGTSDEYARGDHRHPTDTSRAKVLRNANSAGTVFATTLRTQNGELVEVFIPSAVIVPATASGSNQLATAADIPEAQVNADWDATSGVAQILNKPTIPGASTANPAMDGTASPGSSATFARGDHVHPSDTSKQDTIADLDAIRSGADAGATAVQPGDLATVATSGSYADLLNKPSIPAAQVNSDWNASSGVAQILNKPDIPSASDFVQKSGDAMNGPLTAPILFVENTGALVVKGATENSNVSFTESNGLPIVACSESNYNRNFRFPMPPLAIPSGSSVDVCIMDNLAPAFSSSSTYAVGDYVTRDGLLYKCTTAVSTAGAWDAANWTAVAVTDEMDSAIRYSFASPTPSVSGTAATVACEDRAINNVTVATGITSLTITPPAAVTGRARDFFCRVTLTDASLPTVTLSGGTIDIGSTEVAGMTQGVNLIMFTEIASGHWLASRRSAS